jgi:hypothetical protein
MFWCMCGALHCVTITPQVSWTASVVVQDTKLHLWSLQGSACSRCGCSAIMALGRPKTVRLRCGTILGSGIQMWMLRHSGAGCANDVGLNGVGTRWWYLRPTPASTQ